DPVVEPGRGALVPAGHAAGSALARGRWLGLAAGRSLLRPELAPVRGDGWQPVRPVVAAGGARLGRTAGAGRGVLAAAAAWRPRQATGRAAVAAAAVAGPRVAAARRAGAACIRRGAGAGSAGTHRQPCPAVRRRARRPRRLRRR